MIHNHSYMITHNDIDELGHMNYLRYIKHFEIARFAFMESAGFSLQSLLDQQLGTVILKLEMDYVHEVRLGETVEIFTQIIRVGTKSFTFLQEMKKGDQLCAKTTVILTVMDLQQRKAIVVPEKIAQLVVPS